MWQATLVLLPCIVTGRNCGYSVAWTGVLKGAVSRVLQPGPTVIMITGPYQRVLCDASTLAVEYSISMEISNVCASRVTLVCRT